MKHIRKIYIDMDGTLFRFHDTAHEYIEKMWEPGFYRDLQPFQNMVEGIRLFISRNPDAEIYILSAVLPTDPPFIEQEKRESLRKHLPEIPEDHMLFVPAGADKSAYIEPGLAENDYLIDDYNRNLREWAAAGGHSIKFVNDINNKGLGAYGGEAGNIWKGASIRYDQNPLDLCMDMEAITGILPYEKQRMNGFEGDVSIEKLCDNLVPYGLFLKQIEPNHSGAPLLYGTYEDMPDHAQKDSDPAIRTYCASHQLSPAEQSCLESCCLMCAVTGMTLVQLYGYLTASVKAGEWYGNPPTPASLKQFIRQIDRTNRRLSVLNDAFHRISAAMARTEAALYTPNRGDLLYDLTSNGKYQDEMELRRRSLCDELSVVRQGWMQLTGEEYPKLPYGNGVKTFETETSRKKKKDLLEK